MDPTARREGAIGTWATATLIDMLIAIEASPVVGFPASLAVATAELLRSAGVGAAECGRLAVILDDSILGDRCLFTVSLCDAVIIALGAIAETALPEAPGAGRLAAQYRAVLRSEE